MRIIHTVSSTENFASGVTHCIKGLSESQRDAGHFVEIVSLASSKIPKKNENFELKFRNNFLNIPSLHKAGFSSTMKKHIKNNNCDIIHTHGLWMLPNVYRNPKSIFVISPHGMLSKTALKFSYFQKKIFSIFFQNSAFTNSKLLFATAESEYEDIRSYGLQTPVAIIPHGIKIPKIKKTPQKGKKTIISLGRIHPKKGLDILIKAWSGIEPIFKNWQLKIVGPDELGHKKDLEKLIKNLNLKRVIIKPAVYGLEKDLLISQCNLFVLPSRSENFGLTVAESLAVEVPVIATKDTPWSGLESHKCGWWVEGGEFSLFNTLKTVLNLPSSHLFEMGSRGKKWIEQDFSWDIASEKTLETYSWLLNKGQKPSFLHF